MSVLPYTTGTYGTNQYFTSILTINSGVNLTGADYLATLTNAFQSLYPTKNMSAINKVDFVLFRCNAYSSLPFPQDVRVFGTTWNLGNAGTSTYLNSNLATVVMEFIAGGSGEQQIISLSLQSA